MTGGAPARRSLFALGLVAALGLGAASQPLTVRQAQESGGAQATPPGQSAAARGWDQVYGRATATYRTAPNAFLVLSVERMLRERLLPGNAALDLAMGDGRNALLMAEKGLEVTGLDISTVALEKARAAAAEKKLVLHALEQDLFAYDYGQEKWDLITVVYFNPALVLFDRLKAAVKPGGLIVIEGQGSEHLGEGPPQETRFRPNQLLRAFADWRVLDYEDGRFECDWAPGEPTHVVRLMARKPVPRAK